MTREEAADALNDPSWVKAVFFRDPVERLLSAYLVRLTPAPEGSLLCAKLPQCPISPVGCNPGTLSFTLLIYGLVCPSPQTFLLSTLHDIICAVGKR